MQFCYKMTNQNKWSFLPRNVVHKDNLEGYILIPDFIMVIQSLLSSMEAYFRNFRNFDLTQPPRLPGSFYLLRKTKVKNKLVYQYDRH